MDMRHKPLQKNIAQRVDERGAEFLLALESLIEKFPLVAEDAGRLRAEVNNLRATYDKAVPAALGKLENIEDGAQKNATPIWKKIEGKPDFGSMALEDKGGYVTCAVLESMANALRDVIAGCLKENQEITLSGDAEGKGKREIEVKIPGLIKREEITPIEAFKGRVHFFTVNGFAAVPIEMDGMEVTGFVACRKAPNDSSVRIAIEGIATAVIEPGEVTTAASHEPTVIHGGNLHYGQAITLPDGISATLTVRRGHGNA